VSRVTLTGDSPSAHPAREVVGVKAASWQIFGVFERQDFNDSLAEFLTPQFLHLLRVQA
jgi:hypothetical protein